MRQSPVKNQMKAREMFLECHRNKIVHDYNMPSIDLHFDDSITEVMLGEVYIGKAMRPYLSTGEGIERIEAIKEQHRSTLLQRLEYPNGDYRLGWNIHMDYESLIMDKIIDLENIPVMLLTVQSGRSFFQQQKMLKLMHQGSQLASHEPHNPQSAWFSQWGDKWYFKNALTKYRLIDILQQFHESWVEEFAKENPPKHSTLDDVFQAMKDHHYEIHVSGINSHLEYQKILKDNPELKTYARFVLSAMEYNEELRLMRSQSVYDFIQGCIKENTEPYEEFIKVIAERKIRLDEKYGSKK